MTTASFIAASVVVAGAGSAGTPIAPLGFVLVSTAVAFHAVLEVRDAFFAVLAGDALGRVLVAAVARVAIERLGMARLARSGRMVAVEAEGLLVLERRRLPCRRGVARRTVIPGLTMEHVARSDVGVARDAPPLLIRNERRMVERRRLPCLEAMAAAARGWCPAMEIVCGGPIAVAIAASREHVLPEQLVREDGVRPGPTRAEVIAVTRGTSRLEQRLMKLRPSLRADDRSSGRQLEADRSRCVTRDAFLGWRAAKRRMTTEAIGGDRFMTRDEVAGTHRRLGKNVDDAAVGDQKNEEREDHAPHRGHQKMSAIAM